MGSIEIQTITWVKKDKWFFHEHEWVGVHDHPRGGEARFAFMLDYDECDGLEMCLTCKARRYNDGA